MASTTLKGYDEAGALLFESKGSTAARISVAAAADQRAINAAKVKHPTLYRVDVVRADGVVRESLRVEASGWVTWIKQVDGAWVPVEY